jgi:hypothetical protein
MINAKTDIGNRFGGHRLEELFPDKARNDASFDKERCGNGFGATKKPTNLRVFGTLLG